MPGLANKVFICAAVDGLLLHPRGSDPTTSSVRIEYGTNKISTTSAANSKRQDDDSATQVLEAHGIVGLLNLVSSSYLISITRREQVAQIRRHPIYAIRDVTLIPLASQAEAEKAIVLAQKVLRQGNVSSHAEEEQQQGEESDGGLSDVESISDATEQKEKVEDEAAALEPPQGALKRSATVVKSAAAASGGNIGRHAKKWFSKGNAAVAKKEGDLTVEQERQAEEAMAGGEEEAVATDSSEVKAKHEQDQQDIETAATTAPAKKKLVIESLTPRILRGARLYFGSSGFFFSYEHDLSGSLAQKGNISTDIPLWKRFDPLFFWNRHLLSLIIDAGQDSFALPILQGFVGQRAFSVARTPGTEKDVVAEAVLDAEEVLKAQTEAPSDKGNEQATSDFLLTLISRRSIKRAGLRYLRRGVDDDGYTANNVETEQILSSQSWSDDEKAFSLLQVRGSIPLFFSQSPYSFKPLPVMFGSETTNQAAFKRHFDLIGRRYQRVQVASLVDKHGTEVGIGESYERHAKQLNEYGGADGKHLAFEWFDFHSACKGMKFENVSILMDTLKSSLNSFGWLVKQNDRNIRQQTGVLRTNCMDCLDRTNVVQSAVAGWALQQQLLELGLSIDLQTDPKTQWFNTLWADNGDAISRQYAGTSALKGDFTRTRKRNWTGALSDFSLTLNRYYNNIFGDYFLQTCIDYYLGNSGPGIFDEFETDMMAQDYALDLRHVRQNAIETCMKIVLEDPKEEFVAGWTLSCPHKEDTLRTLPFEECVLLLTIDALYFCRFDWETEKVGSFERVALLNITEIWRGVYITSGLGPTHLDEERNVGFAFKYKAGEDRIVRKNTRALGNDEVSSDAKDDAVKDGRESTSTKNTSSGATRLLAFKALVPKAAAAKDQSVDLASVSEVEGVKHICEEIQRVLKAAFAKDRGFQHLWLEKPVEVQERSVISATEARKATGYVESLGYAMKKLVWS